jgi:hypothetical protein
MVSQRERISLKCQLESIEAQIAYIRVQINEIHNLQNLENNKNDLLIQQEFEKLQVAITFEEKQIIREHYEPFHNQFCEFYLQKERDKATLKAEEEKLLAQQTSIHQLLGDGIIFCLSDNLKYLVSVKETLLLSYSSTFIMCSLQ